MSKYDALKLSCSLLLAGATILDESLRKEISEGRKDPQDQNQIVILEQMGNVVQNMITLRKS